MQRLLTRKEVCSGCRACEVACVVRHERCFGVAHGRIKVTKVDSEGLDAPNICRLCRRPTCVTACSTQALFRDEVTGVIHLNEAACSLPMPTTHRWSPSVNPEWRSLPMM